MKMSRTSSYAVQAMLAISQETSGRPVACREIAQARKLPERFLLQILRNLVTHGLLVSVRGTEGGYMLSRAVEDITLLSLIEAIEGPLTSDVPYSAGLAEPIQAKLRLICDDLAAATRFRLAKVTLRDLMPSTPPSRPDVPMPIPSTPPMMAQSLGETLAGPGQ